MGGDDPSSEDMEGDGREDGEEGRGNMFKVCTGSGL